MATITEVNVAQDLTALWGINAYEYKVSGKQVDFQDLMVAVSEKRAVSVDAPHLFIRPVKGNSQSYGGAVPH